MWWRHTSSHVHSPRRRPAGPPSSPGSSSLSAARLNDRCHAGPPPRIATCATEIEAIQAPNKTIWSPCHGRFQSSATIHPGQPPPIAVGMMPAARLGGSATCSPPVPSCVTCCAQSSVSNGQVGRLRIRTRSDWRISSSMHICTGVGHSIQGVRTAPQCC